MILTVSCDMLLKILKNIRENTFIYKLLLKKRKKKFIFWALVKGIGVFM